ncbi:MAG: protochlorophyllide oxidoreductase, partial [Nitrospirae bacterium RIFCSPLOW2_12_42_9]
EAEKRLEQIPLFVRPMAKTGIEKYAREKGYREITLPVMEEAKKRFMG